MQSKLSSLNKIQMEVHLWESLEKLPGKPSSIPNFCGSCEKDSYSFVVRLFSTLFEKSIRRVQIEKIPCCFEPNSSLCKTTDKWIMLPPDSENLPSRSETSQSSIGRNFEQLYYCPWRIQTNYL